jgi:hypothetical protein
MVTVDHSIIVVQLLHPYILPKWPVLHVPPKKLNHPEPSEAKWYAEEGESSSLDRTCNMLPSDSVSTDIIHHYIASRAHRASVNPEIRMNNLVQKGTHPAHGPATERGMFRNIPERSGMEAYVRNWVALGIRRDNA